MAAVASSPRRVRPRTPRGRCRATLEQLAQDFPGTAAELCELRHRNPYELLAATILSAQTTDARVNQVTPALFARYPTPHDLAAADPADVEALIHPTGFFRNKAKSLIGMAEALVRRFDGQVPSRLEDLVTVPGVGRKTANVVRSVGFGLPGLPVDTHVLRLTARLGLLDEPSDDAVAVEHALNANVPARERGVFSLRLILHGRRVCAARRPDCAACSLAWFCPSAGRV